MRITMLGTGNAAVTECYNTCFVLEDEGRRLLVDGGGGQGILAQLKHAGFQLADISEIFVTHNHLDHLMGIVWMMRMQSYIMASGELEQVTIYAHDEVIAALLQIGQLLLPHGLEKAGDRLHLVAVTDGEKRTLMGHDVTFFDIQSTKIKQFGFCMDLGGGHKLTCCGDEPLSEHGTPYAKGTDWLLHEAFCLESEQDSFKPYEKHHSTVASACRQAEELGVHNLLLYHTEDTHYQERQELYLAEGRQFYSGNLYVPYDLDVLEL